MRLAGHSQMVTHMRYVEATSRPLEIPAEMIPKLGAYAQSVQKLRGPKNKPERFVARLVRFERTTFGFGGQRSAPHQ